VQVKLAGVGRRAREQGRQSRQPILNQFSMHKTGGLSTDLNRNLTRDAQQHGKQHPATPPPSPPLSHPPEAKMKLEFWGVFPSNSLRLLNMSVGFV
jgi:hypothetical protein